jgi:hypothetical protein
MEKEGDGDCLSSYEKLCRLPVNQKMGNSFFILPGDEMEKFNLRGCTGKIFCADVSRKLKADMGSIMNFLMFLANVIMDEDNPSKEIVIFTDSSDCYSLVDNISEAITNFQG